MVLYICLVRLSFCRLPMSKVARNRLSTVDQHVSRASDVGWMTSRPPLHGSAVRPPPRLTRKMSVDCLLDHFNSVDAGGGGKLAGGQASRPPSLSRRSPSGYFNGTGSMTSSRSASVDPGSLRGAGGGLARPPLQLRTDLFRPYPSSSAAAGASVPATAASSSSLDGLLSLSVYCGRGLSSAGSRAAALQELYCVAAVDGVSRARTGVQAGATNFDWLNERMNILFISTDMQHSRNSKEQNCVDWAERLKKHLQLGFRSTRNRSLRRRSPTAEILRDSPRPRRHLEDKHLWPWP